MSLTIAVVINAVLVIALLAALTFVLRIPYRLDRSQPAVEPVSIEPAETELAA